MTDAAAEDPRLQIFTAPFGFRLCAAVILDVWLLATISRYEKHKKVFTLISHGAQAARYLFLFHLYRVIIPVPYYHLSKLLCLLTRTHKH